MNNACRVLLCVFALCFVASVAGDDDEYDHDYDDIIPAYGKLVGSGRKRVVLSTMQNVLTISADLFLDALPEVPKKIRPELKKLAYDLQKYDGDDEEYLIRQAHDILHQITKGYDDDCDFIEDLKEAIFVVIVVLQACESEYADRYID